MKERRMLTRDDLRQLCIKKNWYTRGTNGDYEWMLNRIEEHEKENLTTYEIVFIAKNIYQYSDPDYWKDCDDPILNICFEIARVCNTFFEWDK